MAPRRTSRAPKRAMKRVKYSNETFSNAITVTAPAYGANPIYKNYWIPVITPTSVQGMRKAKNFTVSISCIPPTIVNQDLGTIYDINVIASAMLIYVPEGTTPQEPDYTALAEPTWPNAAPLTNVYKPEQNIIMSKLGNITATGNMVMRNRLARNLNSGDTVGVLLTIFETPANIAQTFPIVVSCNYAVTY